MVALIRHWNSFFRLKLMSNFLVQQQGGNKNTQEDKQWIPTVLLYLFNIRMAILEGASQSSTAFFTVWAIYIFPESVHIFFCSRIGRPILERYKSLTDICVYRNWETEHFNSILETTVSFLGVHKWKPDIYIGFSLALYLQCTHSLHCHPISHIGTCIMHPIPSYSPLCHTYCTYCQSAPRICPWRVPEAKSRIKAMIIKRCLSLQLHPGFPGYN